MWELDVSVTADGELIVIHDDTLLRTTNAARVFPDRAPWSFTLLTLAELKTLEAGSFFVDTDPFGLIASSQIEAQTLQEYRTEPIPSLQEALVFTRDNNWRCNIEIKKTPPPMESFPVAERVVELIVALELVEQVLVSSFVPAYLQQINALNSRIKTGLLVERRPPNPLALLSDLRCDAFHPHKSIIDPDQIQQLRREGFDVNVWTVNDQAEMKALIEAGVTGLFTDFPQRLASLKRN